MEIPVKQFELRNGLNQVSILPLALLNVVMEGMNHQVTEIVEERKKN